MVLHPWEQTWGAPCHVHCLIAAGALSAHGARWLAADPRFLCPVRALRTVLRGKCCEALAQGGSTGAVPRVEGPRTLGTPEDCAPLRAQLSTQAWVVYAQRPWQARPPSWPLSAALPIASPGPSIGSSTCGMGAAALPPVTVVRAIVSRLYRSTPTTFSAASSCMCCPAASCVSAMTASAPTGTKRRPCAAVGNCEGSLPSDPHAVHSVWSSGGQRSRGATSRHVRTGARAHSYGSRCLPWPPPRPAAGRLGRCRSTTRHEPSGASQIATTATVTAPSRALGGRACLRGGRPLTWGTRVPLRPVSVHLGGLYTVLAPLRLPLPPTLAAELLRTSCYNPHKDVLACLGSSSVQPRFIHHEGHDG